MIEPTTEIIRERLELWIQDLRTTTEPQTTGALHVVKASPGHNIGFCCLGRAYEVAIKAGFEERLNDVIAGLERYSGKGVCAALDDTARANFGLSWDEHNHLMNMNDDGHHTFADIADWLEKNVLPRYK